MSRLITPAREQASAAPRSYAKELGWKSRLTTDGRDYNGYFRTVGLRYQGWVRKNNSGKLVFYILNPPIDLLRDTDFAGCFHAQNDGWWLVAFKPYDLPADLASGVAAIQKALHKAFELRAARRRW